MPDTRDKKKVLIQKEVVINEIIKAIALDISEEEMYIAASTEFLSGAILDIRFEIEGTPVRVKAIVKQSDPGIGAGVKFLNLSPENFALIRKFIEKAITVTAEKKEKKILLVDDSSQSRAIYRSRLALEDFSVIEASNGLEALKSLQEMKPDLVVLDLWMEGIDGFKILQLIQLNPNLKEVPVIVLSARSVLSDIQKAMSLGAKDFLPKVTTTPVKLAQRVKEILSGK
ncbi:MAG TPA: response regulator [Thermodesulfovibrionales bacterium]|nr:response regulator [Thermodesulfovibrionales bacterium]